ncbi:MAG: hypothetical protein CMM01_22335 [Rhodopirellula sp.]|nr:hypothetical protein [Rhodopirellula sp.]
MLVGVLVTLKLDVRNLNYDRDGVVSWASNIYFCGNTDIFGLVAPGFMPRTPMGNFILILRCKAAGKGSSQVGPHGAARNMTALDAMRIGEHRK